MNRLDDERAWSKTDDRICLYLPPGDKPVRGMFVCFVFHSGDPRELARLWNFALVTVPWPFEYDLGHSRPGDRGQRAHDHRAKQQDMSLLLRYLQAAAKERFPSRLHGNWQARTRACARRGKQIQFEIVSTADGGADIGLVEIHPEVKYVPLSPLVYDCCSKYLRLVKRHAQGWRRSLIILREVGGDWKVTVDLEYR